MKRRDLLKTVGASLVVPSRAWSAGTNLTKPLPKQAGFIASALGLIGFLVMAAMYARFRLPLLLGGVLALFGLAYFIVRSVNDKEKYAGCQEGLRALEDEKRKLERRIELETAPLRALMKKYDIEHPKDLMYLEKDRAEVKVGHRQ